MSETSYATADALFSATTSPEPLKEDFRVEGTDLTIRIVGVAKAHQRREIADQIASHSQAAAKGKLAVIHPVTGELYQPKGGDVVEAAWCAACVISPRLSLLQWLQFAAERSLGTIYERTLVCSRVIGDEATGTPDGEAAAEAAFEEDFTTSAGTTTASKS